MIEGGSKEMRVPSRLDAVRRDDSITGFLSKIYREGRLEIEKL